MRDDDQTDAKRPAPARRRMTASMTAWTRPRHRAICVLAIALGPWLGGSSAQAQAGASAPTEAASASRARPALKSERVNIPFKGAGSFGGDINMVTQVFMPPGQGPFPVLLFSHGRAGGDAERRNMERAITPTQARYWLDRGFAVVAPIRVGYGATGGPDAEMSFTQFNNEGRCTSRPDYAGQANAARKAVMAALEWLRAQPWAKPQDIVLEGQSVGGLATVAAAAQHPAGVVGYINFAGGAGGNPERSPGRGCDPDQLTALYAEYGRSTTVPNLWVYAENDQYWGPDAPKAWHAAFAKGPSKTTFVQAPPVADGDGHGLSRHAPALWSGYLDDFLGSIK